MFSYRIQRRTEPLKWGSFAVFIIALGLSLLLGALLLYLQGKSGAEGVRLIFEGACGSLYGLEDSLRKAIPIFLCSIGVALCFKLQIWNIGAEGQYVLGTIGGAWFALTFTELPAWLMMPGMFACAMLAGGLWAALPALLRQRWGMNEIISTLMLNYIGIQILNYLVYGPWRGPESRGFARTAYFPDSAVIPELFGQVHWGIVTCLAVGLACAFLLRKTRLGFEIEAAGSNPSAARYAGMSYDRLVMLVMALCGAIAGMAGIQECSATLQLLEPNIVSGYGFTAVVVAWLARLSTWRIALFAFLLAALRVGVENMQQDLRVSESFAAMLEGLILLMVLAGQFFDDYAFRRKNGSKAERN